MASGDTLKIAVTGLMAFQRNLSTISHNISNVNTEGYSRQRTELETIDPMPQGNGFIGNGVRVTTTKRMFDQFNEDQLRLRSSTTELYKAYEEFASQVDNLLADKDAGLSPSIAGFFDSVQALADDPSSIPAREVMLTQSGSLMERFHTIEKWISDLRSATNERIRSQVTVINSLAKSIGDANQQIVVALGLGQGQPPNDLLDERDRLITELSKHITVTSVPQDDGSVNVFVGQGNYLVLGPMAAQMTARPNPDDPLNYDVAYVNNFSTTFVPITDRLTGGDIGGVIRFRDEILTPTFNELGRIAIGLALTFNDVHHDGMDLNNQLGQDYFVVPTAEWSDGYTNTGTGSINVAYTSPALPAVGTSMYDVATATDIVIPPSTYDATALGTDDYILRYAGPANPGVIGGTWDFQLVNQRTNSIQTFSVNTGVSSFIQLDGMYIDLNAWSPATGDYINLFPYRGASRQISLAIDDPNEIAAANPIRTDASYTNRGNGVISEVRINNINDPAFAVPGMITPAPVPGSFPRIKVQFHQTAGGLEYFITDDSYTMPTAAPFALPASPPLIGGGPFPYPPPPGTTGILNAAGINWGWDFDITGTPWAIENAVINEGDTFTVEYNTNGVSDNRNALALAQLQSTGTLILGKATYQEAYSGLVTSVGNSTQQAQINHKAQETLLNQTKERKESVSGVNLDEEAANMLRYQQAYSAAAQIIAAADTLFQTLLQAVRR